MSCLHDQYPLVIGGRSGQGKLFAAVKEIIDYKIFNFYTTKMKESVCLSVCLSIYAFRGALRCGAETWPGSTVGDGPTRLKSIF